MLGTAVAALVMAACGGGGDAGVSQDTSASSLTERATELLVIGNSITRHPPLAEINWSHDWGMAATSQDKDFAHLTGAALRLPVTAQNHAALERDPTAAVPAFPVTPRTVVVVELGDNGLPAKYAEIMAAVKGGAALACVSTYWQQDDRDAVIKAECEKAGGRYVYIGDIYPTRQDVMSPELHPFTLSHPGNWSMARISERIVAALK